MTTKHSPYSWTDPCYMPASFSATNVTIIAWYDISHIPH